MSILIAEVASKKFKLCNNLLQQDRQQPSSKSVVAKPSPLRSDSGRYAWRAGTVRKEAINVRCYAAFNSPLRQHRLMKLVPIVEIVQVHRVFWRRSVIRNFACAQNPLARFVVMIVAAHRRVVLLDGVPI